MVAHSGSVLLHFFSDDAYNMSGFNISYNINSCPSTHSRLVCSGHGICDDTIGECYCEPGFTGTACELPICPNDCGAAFGRGECNENKRRYSCDDFNCATISYPLIDSQMCL